MPTLPPPIQLPLTEDELRVCSLGIAALGHEGWNDLILRSAFAIRDALRHGTQEIHYVVEEPSD